MNEGRVLVLCPHPSGKGGVAEYCSMLRRHLKPVGLKISHHYNVTATDRLPGTRLFRRVSNLVPLLKGLRHADLVVLNSSLDIKAVIRDGAYHFLAKRIFGRKTLVFYHAWFPDVERWIARYARKAFRFVFNFDRAIVLAGCFQEVLVSWGYDRQRISVETAAYEHHEPAGDKDRFNVLFLSRFATGKGCLEAVRTVEILSKEYPQLRLYMAGDGRLSRELREYVAKRKLHACVRFTGWVSDEAKKELLSRCGIMLFPTTFGEGMPISIIEGMGMGLAIVTRPVAGIPRVVTEGENGFLVTAADPVAFAAKMKILLQDAALWETISVNNLRKARRLYEVGKVAARIEGIYQDMLGKPAARHRRLSDSV